MFTEDTSMFSIRVGIVAAIVFSLAGSLYGSELSISATATDCRTISGVISDNAVTTATYVVTSSTGYTWTFSASFGGNTFVETGLTPNSGYNYSVLAYYDDEDETTGYWYLDYIATPLSPPATPTGLTFTSNAGEGFYYTAIGIEDANSSDTSYYVIEQDWNVVANPTPLNPFFYAYLSPAFTYNYQVYAVGFDGQTSGYYTTSYTTPTPPAPSQPNLAATMTSAGIQLDWSFTGGPYDYCVIERSVDNGYSFSYLTTVGGTSGSWTDSSICPGTLVYHAYTQNSYCGPSDYSSNAGYFYITLPFTYAYAGLVGNSVQIQWATAQNNYPFNFDGYVFNIERSNDGINFYSLGQVDSGTTTFQDSIGAFPGPYQYRISAVFASGQTSILTSPFSLSFMYTPTIISVSATSTTSADLSFVLNLPNQNLLFFEIQKTSDNRLTWNSAGTPTGSTYADGSGTFGDFTDAAVTEGTENIYMIRAVFETGTSGWSEYPTALDMAPEAPTNLTAQGQPGIVELQWHNVSTHYDSIALNRIDTVTNEILNLSLGSGTTSFIDSPPIIGRNYSYSITAVSHGVQSSSCGPATGSPLPPFFVQKSGDTMTGALAITAANVGLNVTNDSNLQGNLAIGGTVSFKNSTQTSIFADISAYGTGGNNPNSLNIYNRNSGPLVLGTSGTEKLRIDNAGNVGVGKNNPAFKLDVNGTVNANALYVNGSPYVGSQWTTSASGISYAGGKVGIGIATPSEALDVNGGIKCKDLKVTLDGWPDYVFDPSYKLADLKTVEERIKADHHLPGIPSADTVAKEGMSVPKNVAKQLEKIEELTLYVIKLNKEQEALGNLCKELAKQNQALKEQLDALKQH